MPYLSIIVPVYNKIDYIDACITSILKQSFRDFELILINDGSTDQSGARCNYFKSIDDRVIVQHQKNAGVSAARNHGLSIASGQYIGFIDADDTIDLDMYELLVANAKSFDAEISICNLHVVGANKTDIVDNQKLVILEKEAALKNLLKYTIGWSANNKIYKHKLATSVKFEGKINEDLLYCFNVINLMEGKAIFQDIEKYNYLRRENSSSFMIQNQFDSIKISKRIVEQVRKNNLDVLDEAKFLDFIANLSLLNLLILSNQHHTQIFSEIQTNLKQHHNYVSETSIISKKQKYAYSLFNFSPRIYSAALRFYCRFFNSEAAKKGL